MRKLIAVMLVVIMIASLAVVSIQAADTDTAASAAGKATVTLVGIKGETVTKTFNVGDTIQATVYLNAAAALSDPNNGISSVSAVQNYDSAILAVANEYNEDQDDFDYGLATDIDAILPILNAKGNGIVNLRIPGKTVYNSSTPAKAGFKFTTDTSPLVVLQYTVIAPGAVTISNTATTIAESDKMLTRIVDRGEIKNSNFATPVALELISAAPGGATVSGSVKSFLSNTDEITLTLANDENSYTIDPVTGNTASYAFENVASGTYTLTVAKKNHVTREYKDVEVGTDDATLDVKICPIGDVSGNGTVNTQDVAMVNAHAQKLFTLEDYAFLCGDVSHNNKINTQDVAMINSHVQKLYSLWS